MKYPCLLLLLSGFAGGETAWSQSTQTHQQAQNHYETSWAAVQARYPDTGPLPAARSFQFGMGDRRKMTYARGTLRDTRTGEIIHHWETRREIILPSEYTVLLQTRRGTWITIRENQTGVLLREGKIEAYLTRSPLRLPTFRQYPHAPVLRVLHYEVLLKTPDGLDSLAMEVLRLTGNLPASAVVNRASHVGPARLFLRLWHEKSPAR